MSNADNILVSYGEETSYGGALLAAKMINARVSSFEPEQKTETIESDELRSDRNIVDIFRTSISGAIRMQSEFSYSSYDEWLRAQLCSADWTAVVNAATFTNMSVTVPGGVNTITRGAGAWEAGMTPGRWMRFSGFANAANNGYFKILTVAGTPGVMTVSGGTMVAEATVTGAAARAGGFISNGTTFRSFKFEGQFTDLTNEYISLPGKVFGGADLSIAPKQMAKLGWDLIGKSEIGAGATIGDGANTAVNANVPMNCVDNVLAIIENGSQLLVNGFTWKADNGLRTNENVGVLGPSAIKTGKARFTGTQRMYFATRSLMDAYRNFTQRSHAIVLRDSAGNAYVIDCPATVYTGGKQVAGGKDTDIIADMQWAAKMHPTELLSCRITRFATP